MKISIAQEEDRLHYFGCSDEMIDTFMESDCITQLKILQKQRRNLQDLLHETGRRIDALDDLRAEIGKGEKR